MRQVKLWLSSYEKLLVSSLESKCLQAALRQRNLATQGREQGFLAQLCSNCLCDPG